MVRGKGVNVLNMVAVKVHIPERGGWSNNKQEVGISTDVSIL